MDDKKKAKLKKLALKALAESWPVIALPPGWQPFVTEALRLAGFSEHGDELKREKTDG